VRERVFAALAREDLIDLNIGFQSHN